MNDETTAVSSPLADTLAVLAGIDDHFVFRLGIPDDGWIRFSDIDEPLLASWFEQTQRVRGDRRAAVAEVGGWLAYMAVVAWAAPVLVAWRLPLHDLGEVAIRKGDGHPDGIAYAHDSVAALPSDRSSEIAGHLVVSRDEMMVELIDRIEQVAALFDRLRSVARIGRAHLWGEVADSIGSVTLWIARDLGQDQVAAWSVAERLIARLAERRPDVRATPRPFPVAHSQGESFFQIRGTCCLYYRTCADPDPAGDGYCVTCPLRTDDSRTERLRNFIERETKAKSSEGEK